MLPLGVVAYPSVGAGPLGDGSLSIWKKPRVLKLKRALSKQRTPPREAASSHIRVRSEVLMPKPGCLQCMTQTLTMRLLGAFVWPHWIDTSPCSC